MLALWGCGLQHPPTNGAVVVSCDRGEAADVAGLKPGDVVVDWRQGRASGAIESPFHLAVVEQELAPHGPVELIIQRDSKKRRVVVRTGRWRVHLRPLLDEESLTGHLRAKELADSGHVEGAVEEWRRLANAAAELGDTLEAAWFHMREGVALATSETPDECLPVLVIGAETIEDHRLRAAFWERAGDGLLAVGRQSIAARAFRLGIGLLEADVPDSPALAFAQLQLCRANLRGCDPEATRAAEIYLTVGGETIEWAQAVNTLAAIAFVRSDLDAAEEGYRTALDVVRGVAEGSPAECEVLGNLGLLAMRRGDFDHARDFFRREMDSAGRLGSDTPQFSHAANYLGLLAKNMGRYDEARRYYEQALVAFRKTRPGGIEMAGVLTNLANVALLEGNLEAARRHHEEALLLRQGLDPESADVATSLHNVGIVAKWQGDLETARRFLEQALRLKATFSPGSVWIANTLFELGDVARVEGKLQESERSHLSALEIYRRVTPRHPRVSMSLFALGAVEQARGRSEVAEKLWREAIAIIEERRQGMQVSDEDRSQFGARYYAYYGRLARLLVDQGRAAEAWDLLERARAAALREVLARRGAVPANIPSELWFAKNQVERRIGGIEGRIARIDPIGDEQSLHRYREQLNSAEAQLEGVMAAIREAAPRYSAFSSPGAVTSIKTRQSLGRRHGCGLLLRR